MPSSIADGDGFSVFDYLKPTDARTQFFLKKIGQAILHEGVDQLYQEATAQGKKLLVTIGIEDQVRASDITPIGKHVLHISFKTSNAANAKEVSVSVPFTTKRKSHDDIIENEKSWISAVTNVLEKTFNKECGEILVGPIDKASDEATNSAPSTLLKAQSK